MNLEAWIDEKSIIRDADDYDDNDADDADDDDDNDTDNDADNDDDVRS